MNCKGVYKLIMLMLPALFCKAAKEDTLSSLSSELLPQKRIEYLYDQANEIMGSDSAVAAKYIQEGQELSAAYNDERGRIRGKIELARLYQRYNQPHLTLENMLQLFHLHREISFSDSMQVTDILSVALFQLGAIEMAIDYRKLHSSLVKRTNSLPDYYYSSENIAFFYSQLHRYDSANFYYDQANNIARTMNNISMLMHCNNNMGFNYYLQHLYHKSLEKYAIAADLFSNKQTPSTADSLLYAIVIGNIGNVYLQEKEYRRATHHMKQSVEILQTLNKQGIADSLHYGYYLVQYAKVEVILKNYTAAEEMLGKAYGNLKNTPEELIGYYNVLASLYEKKGKKEEVIKALKKQQEAQQEINLKKNKVSSNIHALVKFQESRIRQEIKLLSLLVDSEKQVNTLKIVIVSGISLLILVIGLILFFRYRSEQRKKQKLFEVETNLAKLKLRNKSLESTRLKEVLNYKNKDLVDFAIDITRKHEFIKETLTKLHELKSSNNIRKDLNEVIFYTKSQLQIDDNLKLFQENINKINHEFMARLEKEYPNLTPNEQQICALLRLKLSTKEIAAVKNISPDSVKVLRHRLRKKMNLPPQVSLGKFLDELI